MDPNLPMQMKDYIRPLRAFRETDKQLGTFLRPLRLRSEGGVVDDDGRLRVTWSAHTPVTGRFSSSDPMNVMNWPKFLRELVVPEDGNIFVCADQDALEGRIAAAHWNLKQYLEAFNTPGVDVHQITMLLAFGERIWSMKGAPPVGSYRKKEWTNPDGSKGEIGGEFDELRTLCKRYFYGKIYGASDPVVYELLREAEDDAGNFLYATLTMGKVESISREFLVALPELPRGWDSEIGFFRTHGYTYERITGRRRYFLDGEGDGNEIRNFFDQSAAAGLMNLAMLDMMEALPPFAFGRGTGVIQQNHDSLLLEVPIEKEDWAKRTLKAAMSQHYPDIYAVPFIGKPKSGYSWKKVA
jgi:DNA polymerase I-like protein with 3'-5' exonuclease and polymerase domains